MLTFIVKIKEHSDAERIVVQPERENRASCGVLRSCGFAYDDVSDIYVLPL
ncbi:hypothetical protein CE91St64_33030 [Faecalicatena contorta]|uniref:hypothetical protein n=1 Tax=Faecalicatena contorta TaxID=39482 RepID=UPI0004B8F121|nr:hypothetical protein [Faecalicatena contorta]GKH33896.1 hypothetical protein CE91St64_33030 [Faecalicatena contorta]